MRSAGAPTGWRRCSTDGPPLRLSAAQHRGRRTFLAAMPTTSTRERRHAAAPEPGLVIAADGAGDRGQQRRSSAAATASGFHTSRSRRVPGEPAGEALQGCSTGNDPLSAMTSASAARLMLVFQTLPSQTRDVNQRPGSARLAVYGRHQLRRRGRCWSMRWTRSDGLHRVRVVSPAAPRSAYRRSGPAH